MFYVYIILGVIALVVALSAEIKVKGSYAKYSQIATSSNMTASQFARKILDDNGLQNISVNHIRGELTDNYHHSKKALNLSDNIYDNNSIAALAVAAHEAGHALQYKAGYFPIKLRNLIIPITNFASKMLIPLVIIGIILMSVNTAFNLGEWFINASLIILFLSVLINLVTLPVEFDASKRAMKQLESSGNYSQTELVGAKSMLNAAALTYVASLAVSIIYFIRFLLIFRSND